MGAYLGPKTIGVMGDQRSESSWQDSDIYNVTFDFFSEGQILEKAEIK